MPGRPGAGRGRAPIIATPGGRFHPVGCFRRTLFVRRQRDHPAEDMEHGNSPGASWGVWAKASGTVARSVLVLGMPPCRKLALTSATVQGSGRSGVLWGLMEKTMIRHVIAGTESELSAQENPLEFDRRRKRVDRRHGPVYSSRHVSIQLRIIAAHEAGARVANGISARRFLSQKQLQITIIPRIMLPRTASRFLVAIRRAERTSPGLPVGPIPGPAPNCELWLSRGARRRTCFSCASRKISEARTPYSLASASSSFLSRSSTRTLMRSMRISRDEVFV